ncbi:MAG: carbohydrate binding domain-containing protein, partial [Promicromonosporaceae bacterium]|nr:carbohydrate binding domain-containing protein [Promicromonosporaceae bacterium]
MTAIGAATAMLATGLVAAATPAAASGPNMVLSIAQTADWQGLQIPGSYFEDGATYRLEARVLADEFFSGNARFVSQSAADISNSNVWLTNVAINPNAWTNLTATWTPRAAADGGTSWARIVAGAPGGGNTAGTFLVDDVVLTRTHDTSGVPLDPPVEVFHIDFDTTFPSWGNFPANVGDGGTFAHVVDPLWQAPPNMVQQVTTAANWGGPQINHGTDVDFIPGATFGFSGWVLADEFAPAGSQARFMSSGFSWIGNTNVFSDSWTEIGSTFTVPAAGINWVRIAMAGPANADITTTWFLDDVVVTQLTDEFGADLPEPLIVFSRNFNDGISIPGDGASGVTIVPDPLAPGDDEGIRITFDFEEGHPQGWTPRSVAAGTPTLAIISPGADGSTYALSVTNRLSQGMGAMIDLAGMLPAGAIVEFSADVRFLEAGSVGSLTVSRQTDAHGLSEWDGLMPTFTGIGTDWTTIEGVFTVPGYVDVFRPYFETPWADGDPGDITPFAIDN